MTDLTDDLLKHLAEGSGRCYPHEGKAMAQELIRRRAAANTPQPASNPYGGIPIP